MLENENDNVKLLGMHDRLFCSNAEVVNIYGYFSGGITACATELEIVAEHSDLAIKMLGELHSKMVLLDPSLERNLRAPVARILPFPQESTPTTSDPRLLPFQSAPTKLPIGAGLREEQV